MTPALRFAFKWLVAAAVLAAAFWYLDLDALLASIKQVSWVVCGIAGAMTMLHFLLLALRWRILAHGVIDDTRGQIGIYFLGLFFSSFTPANVGGDVYRYTKLRHAAPASDIVATLLSERCIGWYGASLLLLVAYGVVELGATALAPELRNIVRFTLLLAATATAGLLGLPLALRRWPRSKPGRLDSLRTLVTKLAAAAYPDVRPSRVLLLLALSVAAFVVWVVAVWTVLAAVGVALEFWLAACVAIVVELIRIVPISAQGIGVREAAYATLISSAGYSGEAGFAGGLVAYAILTFAICVCGVVGWMLRNLPVQK